MILPLIRQLRLACILLLVSSAAVGQESGQPREGGLTGTGIMGVLNNEGVLEIGGFAVNLPTDLSVRTPLGPAVMDEMQTGDMIAFQFDGMLQNLTVVDAQQVIQIIGPITLQTDDILDVMGTKIFTAGVENTTRAGDWVAISGYWREDGLIATRIAVVPPQDAVRIQGTYQALSPDLGKVGETLVKGQLPMPVAQGEVVKILGHLENGVLLMNTSEVENFAQGVRTALVQGYQSTPDKSGFYTILGTGITSVTAMPEMISWQELVTICSVDGELVTGQFFATGFTALCEQ